MKRLLAAATAVLTLLVLGAQPAHASPAVFPAPASGLLWIDLNYGGLSQWNLHGTSAVSGTTTWALWCDRSSCWPRDTMVAIADFDGDGTQDLITRDSWSDDLTLHLNAMGSGTVNRPLPCPSDCQTTPIGARDFNRDGTQDLAFYSEYYGRVTIVLMDGHGNVIGTQWITESCTGCRNVWWPVGVGDLNSDGYPDILWWNVEPGGAGWLHGWLLNGSGGLVGKLNLTWPCADACRLAPWNPIGLGDMDGDGDQDLVWLNGAAPGRPDAGRVTWWTLDGHGAVLGDVWLDPNWTCDNACYQNWNPVGIVNPEKGLSVGLVGRELAIRRESGGRCAAAACPPGRPLGRAA